MDEETKAFFKAWLKRNANCKFSDAYEWAEIISPFPSLVFARIAFWCDFKPYKALAFKVEMDKGKTFIAAYSIAKETKKPVKYKK